MQQTAQDDTTTEIAEASVSYGKFSEQEMQKILAADIAYVCNEPIGDCPFRAEPDEETAEICHDAHIVCEFADALGEDPRCIAKEIEARIGRPVRPTFVGQIYLPRQARGETINPRERYKEIS